MEIALFILLHSTLVLASLWTLLAYPTKPIPAEFEKHKNVS